VLPFNSALVLVKPTPVQPCWVVQGDTFSAAPVSALPQTLKQLRWKDSSEAWGLTLKGSTWPAATADGKVLVWNLQKEGSKS